MDLVQETNGENVAAGVLGALLGALAGLICGVLAGRLRIVAVISGLVMGICAPKAYQKLAGTFSKRGAVISCAIIVLTAYLTHHLNVAIAVAEELGMSLSHTFLSLPRLLWLDILDVSAFLRKLGHLYLFAGLGFVPTICSILGSPGPSLIPVQKPAERAVDAPPRIEFYAADPLLSRTVRIGEFILSLAVGLLGMGMLLLGYVQGTYALLLAGAAAFFSTILLYSSAPYYLADLSVLYVRVNGTLWRISLSMLNRVDAYCFTIDHVVNGEMAVRWNKLMSKEQERAKASILRAIEAQTSGLLLTDGFMDQATLPLTDLIVEKETKWVWKISYLSNDGKRRRLSIHKVYPDFAPTPEQIPSCGPVPFHWDRVLIALILVLAFSLLGAAIDAVL